MDWVLSIIGFIMMVVLLAAYWYAAKYTNELLSPVDSCSMEGTQIQLPTPYLNSNNQLVYLDPRLKSIVEVGQTMVPAREACGENTVCIQLIASPCDGSVHPINGQYYLSAILS